MKNITNADESFSTFKKYMKGSVGKKTKVEERNDYYASCLRKPIQENVILFKSNNGFSMEGDSKAIFEQLLHDKIYKKYRFVWVLKNQNICEIISQEYRGNRRVQFVVIESREYLKYLAKSKYIISDDRLPVWFIRREEQVYIRVGNRFENFKRGYRKNENFINDVRMEEKDYLCSNILLSPSVYFTEEIYAKAFKLENIYEGRIVKTIAPRHQVIRGLNLRTAKKRCSSYGLDSTKKQILLVFGMKGLFEEKIKFCKQMDKLLPSDEYQICIKVISGEFVTMQKMMKDTGVFVIKNFMDMNLWLAAADYLVGDGAGYTFDYLATGRMIVFTDLYGIRKGEILSEEELPGPTAHTPEDVVQFIKEEGKNKRSYEKKYEKCVKRFISDGTKKDLFENGKVKDDIGEHLNKSKEKLLFIVPTASVCWTMEFFQMLRRMDYEKYDVTVVSNRPNSFHEEIEIEKNMNGNVRMFYRTGYMIQTDEKYMQFKYLAYNLFSAQDMEEVFSLTDAYDCKNEWIRICGYVTFDRLIYVKNPTPEFLLLTDCLDVKNKICFDWGDYEELFSSRMIADKVRTYFDKIVDPSENMDFFLKRTDNSENYPNVDYQKCKYEIINLCTFEDGQIRMTMVKSSDQLSAHLGTVDK